MLVKTVPQGHCLIVERFGRPVRVVHSGLHFFLPFFDDAKDVSIVWGDETNKERFFIELSEQIMDSKPREYITKDNVVVMVDCVYNWRIVDPIKAVYDVDWLHKSLLESVLNQIRSFVGAHDLNYILTSRNEISDIIVANLSELTTRWGIKLIKAEIQELKTDDATRDAMRQEMVALRKGKAAKLESEGQAEAMLRLAEAQKKATILKAEGEQKALALLAQGDREYVELLTTSMGKEEAYKILLAQKTLQAYSSISNNNANKVFLPPPAAASLLMFDKTEK